MAAGIKVVGVDSSPAVGAYNVFVNQADTAGVGKGLADMACDEAPSCTGEVAVLSAAQTATNQNAWIAAMQTTLKDAKYSKLVFDGVYYGNDDPQISTTQAQAMLAAHPNLKVIIAPTTVGIVAAAQVVTSQNLVGKVFVGGLGFPKAMQTFVKSGVAPEFGLWNVSDLGYLAYATAVGLVNGTIKGTVGETYSVPSYATLNGGQPYTIGKDNIVVLGPVFMFTPGLDNWGSGVQTAVAGNGDGYGNFYYVYWWSCSYWDTNKGSYTIQPMYYTWLYDQTYYRNNQQYSGSQIDGGLTANVGAASSYVSRQFYRPDPPYPVIYWTYSTFSAIS
jgi:hypothetical protein